MISGYFLVNQFLIKKRAEASGEHHQRRCRTDHRNTRPRTWMTVGIAALATLAAMATITATTDSAQAQNPAVSLRQTAPADIGANGGSDTFNVRVENYRFGPQETGGTGDALNISIGFNDDTQQVPSGLSSTNCSLNLNSMDGCARSFNTDDFTIRLVSPSGAFLVFESSSNFGVLAPMSLFNSGSQTFTIRVTARNVPVNRRGVARMLSVTDNYSFSGFRNGRPANKIGGTSASIDPARKTATFTVVTSNDDSLRNLSVDSTDVDLVDGVFAYDIPLAPGETDIAIAATPNNTVSGVVTSISGCQGGDCTVQNVVALRDPYSGTAIGTVNHTLNDLQEGINTVNIVVTAENDDTQTYILKVTALPLPSSDASLTELTVGGVTVRNLNTSPVVLLGGGGSYEVVATPTREDVRGITWAIDSGATSPIRLANPDTDPDTYTASVTGLDDGETLNIVVTAADTTPRIYAVVVSAHPGTPTLALTATDAAADEVGPDTGQFTINLTNASAVDTTFAFSVAVDATVAAATDGNANAGRTTDYTITPSGHSAYTAPDINSGQGGSITMSGTDISSNGAAEVTLLITPLTDDQVEYNETVILTIAPPDGITANPAENTVIINDVENQVAVALTGTLDESDGSSAAINAVYTSASTSDVHLHRPLGLYLSTGEVVDGATEGTDYLALVSAPLAQPTLSNGVFTLQPVCSAPECSVSMTIPVVVDVFVEGSESLTLAISEDNPATDGTTETETAVPTFTTRTVEITDDDSVSVQVVLNPTGTQETPLREGTMTSATVELIGAGRFDEPVTFTLELDEPRRDDINLDGGNTTTVTIPRTQNVSAAAVVAILSDVLQEGQEALSISIKNNPTDATNPTPDYSRTRARQLRIAALNLPLTSANAIIDDDDTITGLSDLTVGTHDLSTGGRAVATFDANISDYGVTLPDGVIAATIVATPAMGGDDADINISVAAMDEEGSFTESCGTTLSGINSCTISGIGAGETAVATITVTSVNGLEVETYTVTIGPAYARVVGGGTIDRGATDADAFTIRIRNYKRVPDDGFANIRIDTNNADFGRITLPPTETSWDLADSFNPTSNFLQDVETADFNMSIAGNTGPDPAGRLTRSAFNREGSSDRKNFRISVPQVLLRGGMGSNPGVNSEDVVVSLMAKTDATERDTVFQFGASRGNSFVTASDSNYGTVSGAANHIPRGNASGIATIAVTRVVGTAALTADPGNAASEFSNVTGTATLALSNVTEIAGDATVSFILADSTATRVDDYILSVADSADDLTITYDTVDTNGDGLGTPDNPHTFTIPAANLADGATFTVTPVADGVVDDAENVVITVTSVVFAADTTIDIDSFTTDKATIAIADYGTLPTVGVVASSDDDNIIIEDTAGPGTFTITLTNAPAKTATLDYTLVVSGVSAANSDITAAYGAGVTGVGDPAPVLGGGTGQIAMSGATGAITVRANRDSDTDDEIVTFTITNVTFDDTGNGTDITDLTLPGNTDTADIIVFEPPSFAYADADTGSLATLTVNNDNPAVVGTVTFRIRNYRFPTTSEGANDVLAISLTSYAIGGVNNDFYGQNRIADTRGKQSLVGNLATIRLADVDDTGSVNGIRDAIRPYFINHDNSGNIFRLIVPKALLATTAGTQPGIGAEDIVFRVDAGGTNSQAGTYGLGFQLAGANAAAYSGTTDGTLDTRLGAAFRADPGNTEDPEVEFTFRSPTGFFVNGADASVVVAPAATAVAASFNVEIGNYRNALSGDVTESVLIIEVLFSDMRTGRSLKPDSGNPRPDESRVAYPDITNNTTRSFDAAGFRISLDDSVDASIFLLTSAGDGFQVAIPHTNFGPADFEERVKINVAAINTDADRSGVHDAAETGPIVFTANRGQRPVRVGSDGRVPGGNFADGTSFGDSSRSVTFTPIDDISVPVPVPSVRDGYTLNGTDDDLVIGGPAASFHVEIGGYDKALRFATKSVLFVRVGVRDSIGSLEGRDGFSDIDNNTTRSFDTKGFRISLDSSVDGSIVLTTKIGNGFQVAIPHTRFTDEQEVVKINVSAINSDAIDTGALMFSAGGANRGDALDSDGLLSGLNSRNNGINTSYTNGQEPDTVTGAVTYTPVPTGATVQPNRGSITEAAGTTNSVDITVTLDVPAPGQVILPFTITPGNTDSNNPAATHGGDYEVTSAACDPCLLVGSSLVFAKDDQVKTFTVTATDDLVDDDNETVTIALTPGTYNGVAVGADASAVITIVDDDVPQTLALTATAPATENSATEQMDGAFTVSLALNDPAATTDLVYTLLPAADGDARATEGDDYTITIAPANAANVSHDPADVDSVANTGTFSLTTDAFDVDTRTATFDVIIDAVSDNIVEGPETVVLSLAAPDGVVFSDSPATVTIDDEDDNPDPLNSAIPAVPVNVTAVVTRDNVNVAENTPNIQAWVTLDKPFATEVIIPLELVAVSPLGATIGTDVTPATGMITIEAGETNSRDGTDSFLALTFPVDADTGDETFRVTVTAPPYAGLASRRTAYKAVDVLVPSVTVTIAASGDHTLSALSADDGDITLVDEEFHYIVTPLEVGKFDVDIAATPTDIGGFISSISGCHGDDCTVQDVVVLDGSYTGDISATGEQTATLTGLQVGENTVNVAVTAEDGSSQTYEITVTAVAGVRAGYSITGSAADVTINDEAASFNVEIGNYTTAGADNFLLAPVFLTRQGEASPTVAAITDTMTREITIDDFTISLDAASADASIFFLTQGMGDFQVVMPSALFDIDNEEVVKINVAAITGATTGRTTTFGVGTQGALLYNTVNSDGTLPLANTEDGIAADTDRFRDTVAFTPVKSGDASLAELTVGGVAVSNLDSAPAVTIQTLASYDVVATPTRGDVMAITWAIAPPPAAATDMMRFLGTDPAPDTFRASGIDLVNGNTLYLVATAADGTTQTHNVSVTVVPPTPTLTVIASDTAAAEAGPDTGQFTISLRNAIDSVDTTFAYSLAVDSEEGDANATLNTDYMISVGGAMTHAPPDPVTGADGSITISQHAITTEFNNETSVTLTITPTPDTRVENPETVILTIEEPSDPVGTVELVSGSESATVVIADAPDQITVSVDDNVVEGEAAVVRFTAPAGTILDRAVSGLQAATSLINDGATAEDYTERTGFDLPELAATTELLTTELGATCTTGVCVVEIVPTEDDSFVEGDETFNVAISELTADPAVADHRAETVTIMDDDVVTATVMLDTTSPSEGGTVNGSVVLTGDGRFDEAVHFTLALIAPPSQGPGIADTDDVALADTPTVTILPSADTSDTTPIGIVIDGIAEVAETFSIEISEFSSPPDYSPDYSRDNVRRPRIAASNLVTLAASGSVTIAASEAASAGLVAPASETITETEAAIYRLNLNHVPASFTGDFVATMDVDSSSTAGSTDFVFAEYINTVTPDSSTQAGVTVSDAGVITIPEASLNGILGDDRAAEIPFLVQGNNDNIINPLGFSKTVVFNVALPGDDKYSTLEISGGNRTLTITDGTTIDVRVVRSSLPETTISQSRSDSVSIEFSVPEAAGGGNFTVMRDVEVTVTITAGSSPAAEAGVDFIMDGVANVSTATLNSNDPTIVATGKDTELAVFSGLFTTATNDFIVEGDENLTVTITSSDPAVLAANIAAPGTVVIGDDDTAFVKVRTSRTAVTEGDAGFKAWVDIINPDVTFVVDADFVLGFMGTTDAVVRSAGENDVLFQGDVTTTIKAGKRSSVVAGEDIDDAITLGEFPDSNDDDITDPNSNDNDDEDETFQIAIASATYAGDRDLSGGDTLLSSDAITISDRLTFDNQQANLTFTVGSTVGTTQLPGASGGSGGLAYSLANADILALAAVNLAYSAAARTISGTSPITSAFGPITLTYTVTDDKGNTLSQMFNVSAVAAPTFGTVTRAHLQYTEGTGMIRVGDDLAAKVDLPTATGGVEPLLYTLLPTDRMETMDTLSSLTSLQTRIDTVGELPTPVIFGTPTAELTRRSFTLTVRDANSVSDTVVFDITVNPVPTFSGTQAPLTYTDGVEALAVLTPVASGGTGTLDYTIVGSLPNGLIFTDNTADGTRTITGMSSAAYEDSPYTLTLRATDDNGAVVDATPSFRITIIPAPSVSITRNRDAVEAGTVGIFDVALANVPAGSSPVINFTIGGDANAAPGDAYANDSEEDYTYTSTGANLDRGQGTLQFPSGTTTATIEIDARSDNRLEAATEDVTIRLVLSDATVTGDTGFVFATREDPATGGTITENPATITIADTENQITVEVDPASLAEGATSIPVTFTAAADIILDRDVKLRLSAQDKSDTTATASRGTDFPILDNILVTLPDETDFSMTSAMTGDPNRGTATTEIVDVNINIFADSMVEGDEVFVIQFSEDDTDTTLVTETEPAVMLPTAVDVTITDGDDGTPVVATVSIVNADGDTVTTEVSEGAAYDLTVTLTGRTLKSASTFTPTLTGTAQTADVTLCASITIDAGAPSGSCEITIVNEDDRSIENENFGVTVVPGLTNPPDNFPTDLAALFDITQLTDVGIVEGPTVAISDESGGGFRELGRENGHFRITLAGYTADVRGAAGTATVDYAFTESTDNDRIATFGAAENVAKTDYYNSHNEFSDGDGAGGNDQPADFPRFRDVSGRGSIVFPANAFDTAGNATLAIALKPQRDNIVEGPETMELVLSNANRNAVITTGTVRRDITDNPIPITAVITATTDVNEDDMPGLSLINVNEADGQIDITVTFSVANEVVLERDIVVELSTARSGAVQAEPGADEDDEDYIEAVTDSTVTLTASRGEEDSVTFNGNYDEEEFTAMVTINDDTVVEGPETFAIVDTNNDAALTVNPTTVTITDNDTTRAKVVLVGDGQEGAPLTARVDLISRISGLEANTFDVDTEFTLNLVAGTATGASGTMIDIGADVTLPDTPTVTVPAGTRRSGPLDVTIRNDSVNDAGENFQVKISSGRYGTNRMITERDVFFDPSALLATSEGPALTVVPTNAEEAGEVVGTFVISLDGATTAYNTGATGNNADAPDQDIKVNYTIGGTATPTTDYTLGFSGATPDNAGFFTIANSSLRNDGTATVTITVTPEDDDIIEALIDETVTLNITSASAVVAGVDVAEGAVSVPAVASLNIVDRPNILNVAIFDNDGMVEGGTAGTADISVTFTPIESRTVTLERAVEVHLTTSGTASAVAGTDFTALSVPVQQEDGTTLAAGDTVTVDAMLVNDMVVEGDETFTGAIANNNTDPDPAVNITDADAIFTILANDTDRIPEITGVTLQNAREGEDSSNTGSTNGRVRLMFRDLIPGESMEVKYTINPVLPATDTEVLDTTTGGGAIGDEQTIMLSGSASDLVTTDTMIDIEFMAVYDSATDVETVEVTINSVKFTPHEDGLIRDVLYDNPFNNNVAVDGLALNSEGAPVVGGAAVAGSVATLTLLQSGEPSLTVATSGPTTRTEGDTGALDFEIMVNNGVPGEDVAFNYVLGGTATVATGTATSGGLGTVMEPYLPANADYTVAAFLDATPLAITAARNPVVGENSGRITVAGTVIDATIGDGSNGAAGSAKVTLRITPIDDNRVEALEMETIILTNLSERTAGVGYNQAVSTRTIVDKPDIIAVTLADASLELDEGSTDGVTLNFDTTDAAGTRPVVLERAITVNLSTGAGGTVQATPGANADYMEVSPVGVFLSATTIPDETTLTETEAITINNDDLVEGPETFSVFLVDVLDGGDDHAVTVTSPTAVTIIDGDAAPEVMSVVLTSPPEDGNVTDVVTITLDRALHATETLSVPFTIGLAGTATATEDTTATAEDFDTTLGDFAGGTKTIRSGENSAVIQLAAMLDAPDEMTNTFQVNFLDMAFDADTSTTPTPGDEDNIGFTNAAVTGDGSFVKGSGVATLTILEGPQPMFASPTAIAREADTSISPTTAIMPGELILNIGSGAVAPDGDENVEITFTIGAETTAATRAGDNADTRADDYNLTVREISTTGADLGALTVDYLTDPNAPTFTIPGNATDTSALVQRVKFIVTPVNDTVDDDGETVTINITGVEFENNPSDNLTGLSVTGTVTIADDPAHKPTATLTRTSGSDTVSETGDGGNFEIALSYLGDVSNNVVIPYRLTSSAPDVTYGDDETTDDYTFESADANMATVTTGTDGSTTVNGSITVLPAALSGTVNTAAAGGTVTVTIDPRSDGLGDSNETVTLDITMGDGTKIPADLVIDQDTTAANRAVTFTEGPALAFAADNAAEADTGDTPAAATDGSLTLTFTDKPVGEYADITFTLDGTATFATDYTLGVETGTTGAVTNAAAYIGGNPTASGGEFRLPAGHNIAEIIITPVADDATDDDAETVEIVITDLDYQTTNDNDLTGLTGASVTRTITIADDPAHEPTVALTRVNDSAAEGAASGGADFTITLSYFTANAGDLTVPYTLTQGTPPAVLGTDYNFVSVDTSEATLPNTVTASGDITIDLDDALDLNTGTPGALGGEVTVRIDPINDSPESDPNEKVILNITQPVATMTADVSNKAIRLTGTGNDASRTVTITEGPPVAFSSTAVDTTGAEDGGTGDLILTVGDNTIPKTVAASVTFTIDTDGNNATFGTDYDLVVTSGDDAGSIGNTSVTYTTALSSAGGVFTLPGAQGAVRFGVTSRADRIDDDAETVIITVTRVDYPTRTQDNSPQSAEGTVTITDDDDRGVTIGGSPVAVTEGLTNTYTVVLDTQPTGPVTITAISGDTGAVTVSAPLMFTTGDWSTPKPVTVTAVQDADAANEAVTLTHTVAGAAEYDGFTPAIVTVNVTEDDSPGVTITANDVTVTAANSAANPVEVTEGETAGTYTVVLDTLPTGNVTVAIAEVVDDPAVSVNPTSLQFTTSTWSMAQTVMVTAAEEADQSDTDDETVTLNHTVTGAAEYAGFTTASVTVEVTDDDMPGVTITNDVNVTITATNTAANPVTVDEGGMGTYTVKLNTQPTGNVVIAIRSNNTDVTVTNPTLPLTFTAGDWNMPQTVTVTAAEDADAANDTATLRHTVTGPDAYASVTAANITVMVTDGDTRGVTITPTSLTVDEVDADDDDNVDSSTGTYTVVLTAAPTGGNVTIAITVGTDNDGESIVTVRPTSLTFNAGTWSTAQTVTVSASEDADRDNDEATLIHTVSGADYQTGVAAADVTVTVNDNVHTLQTVDGTPIPTPPATTRKLTVMGTGTLTSTTLSAITNLTELEIQENVTVQRNALNVPLGTVEMITVPENIKADPILERVESTAPSGSASALNGGGGPVVLQDGMFDVTLANPLPYDVTIKFELEPDNDTDFDTVDFAAGATGRPTPVRISYRLPTGVRGLVGRNIKATLTHAGGTGALHSLMDRESVAEALRAGDGFVFNLSIGDPERETEAITTVLAREQVAMMTRLVRQRVQDLALARPDANTTANTTASNDDMQVSLAQSPDNMQDFVSGLALTTARDMDDGGSYSLWARGQWVGVSGSPDIGVEGFNYDGSIVGAGAGVEFRDYNSMYGLALNATRSKLDITTAEGASTHEEDVIFAAPYAVWKPGSSGLTLWGTVGVGTGSADITDSDGNTASPDVGVFFIRGGADIVEQVSDQTNIVFGMSGLFIDKTVDAFTLGGVDVGETNVGIAQTQADMTVFFDIPAGDGVVRPYFGLASVHDFSDTVAQDPHALEGKAGIAWGKHPWSASVDGFYEFLRNDQKAWGVFGEIAIAQTDGGFQFGLTGNHGTAGSMSDAVTSTNTVASELGGSLSGGGAQEATWSLGAESSYSFAAPVVDPGGTAAPFVSGTHAESGQTLGTGVRVGLTGNIDMTVESNRRMPSDGVPYSEHAVGLNARWAF